MSIVRYRAEGQAQGTVVTAANSGADQVVSNGGTTIFDAAAANGSGFGMTFTNVAGTNGSFARFLAAATNTKMAFSGVFSIAASPADLPYLHTIRHTSGRALVLAWDAQNRLSMYDSTNSNFVYIAPTGNTLTPGTKYRIELVMTGGSATASTVSANLYVASTGAKVNAATVTASNFNMSTNPLTGGDFGIASNSAPATVTWDDIQFNDGGTTEIGPYVPAASGPLAVNAGLDQSSIEPFSTVTLYATASNPGGTVSGIVWTQVSGTTVTLGGSGATRTFEAPGSVDGATLVFRATATGS